MKKLIDIFRKDIIGWIIILIICLISSILPYIGIVLIILITLIFSYQAKIDSKLTAFIKMKKEYLSSLLWLDKKVLVLTRDNHTCQSCGSQDYLEVHHLRGYNLIPNEHISDLVALCRKCHHAQHKALGFPKTYNDYMKWDTKLIKFEDTL